SGGRCHHPSERRGQLFSGDGDVYGPEPGTARRDLYGAHRAAAGEDAPLGYPMPSARLVDLSHTIEAGMITYRGLPAPVICDYLSREDSRSHYAPGTEFNIGRIDMVANTGTYVDSPFHRFADGADLSELPLARLADLEALVVTAPPGRAIDVHSFAGLEVS